MSMSIDKIIELRHFPYASIESVLVAPPSSALYNTKFKAPNLGSSYLTTLPLTKLLNIDLTNLVVSMFLIKS